MATRLSQSGIQPGDLIAISHPKEERLIALFFAAWRLHAAICPLSLRLPPLQLNEHLSRLNPSLYLSSFDPFPPAKRTSQPIPADLLLFTSGSTGTPKIAALTLASLIANAEAVCMALDLQPQDRWLLSLPLFHIGGIGLMLRCILAQATILLDEKNPDITHISYVPTQLYRSTPVYKKLRCVLLGGAPIHSSPPYLPIYASYGLTEMGSLVTARFQPPEKNDQYHLGPPLKGREVRLASDGEIEVRGACLFQGYWEKGILSPALNEEGWFATGDLGILCPQDGLAITGRKDWQFISGGENIQPEEIEQALLTLPEIVEAVVVPLADREFGKRPAACVRTNDPAFNLSRMQTKLRDRLPKYKIPIALLILNDIPKNGLKVDRKKVLAMLTKIFSTS